MKWILATPYIKKMEKSIWTIAEEKERSLKFILSPTFYEHNRSRKNSTIRDWGDYWQHASDAFQKAEHYNCGIITAFPQLPICAGFKKRHTKISPPIIASTFNLGALHGGYKQSLARYCLKYIDKFTVHSSAEIINYSQYLNLPKEKFEFVPLHKPIMPLTEHEENESPFILSIGSANRDYETLLAAIKNLGYPLTIVAPKYALSNLIIPKNVTVKSNLTLTECRSLVQKARINVIPIQNQYTASGQVTLIEAMMYRKAVITTDTIGTRDYVINNKTGIMTKNKSVTDLENAIHLLWNNESIRDELAIHAHEYVKTELSREKAADRLLNIINNI